MAKRMQGFSLLEVLLVSALGSLILMAATQVFGSLAQQQRYTLAWLQLEDRARLAAMTLKRDLSQSFVILEAGSASSIYPDLGRHSLAVSDPLLLNRHFNHFRSSDWLLVNRASAGATPDFSLWHLDKKTYGFGLANKASRHEEALELSASNTVISSVELLRFRMLDPDSGLWRRPQELAVPWEQVNALQFALLLASEQPVLSGQPAAAAEAVSFNLWGELLLPPDDGRLRTLVTGRVFLQEAP